MSLYGRNIIDRIKSSISHRLTLPVPPYHSPKYWDEVYKNFNENDVFEWGDLNFETDLKSFKYKLNKDHIREIEKVYGETIIASSSISGKNRDYNNDDEAKDITFHEALFPQSSVQKEYDKGRKNIYVSENNNSSILILGCGNSRLGEDILHYYLDMNMNSKHDTSGIIHEPIPRPLVAQCDISTHVVNSMTKRYHKYIETNQMSILQDDATQLTLFEEESMDAIVDKGLVDALFCSDHGHMIQQVMNSVHRTLKFGKVFMFFSYSRPEYLLKYTKFDTGTNQTMDDTTQQMITYSNKKIPGNTKWKSINVLELDQIFLYRFIKTEKDTKNHSKKGKQMQLKTKKN